MCCLLRSKLYKPKRKLDRRDGVIHRLEREIGQLRKTVSVQRLKIDFYKRIT